MKIILPAIILVVLAVTIVVIVRLAGRKTQAHRTKAAAVAQDGTDFWWQGNEAADKFAEAAASIHDVQPGLAANWKAQSRQYKAALRGFGHILRGQASS